jgi:tetratricopeptide (TPR) repeat protein
MDTGELFDMIQNAGNICGIDFPSNKADTDDDELSDWLANASVSEFDEMIEIVGDDLQTKASLLCTIGMIYMAKNEIELAQQMYQEAMEIYKQFNNKKEMAFCCERIGIIFLLTGQLQAAEEIYNQVLQFDKQFGNAQNIAIGYCNLGIIYSAQCKWGLAEQMYEEALKIDKSSGYKEGISKDFYSLGLLYHQIGNKDMAKKYFAEAAKNFPELDKSKINKMRHKE